MKGPKIMPRLRLSLCAAALVLMPVAASADGSPLFTLFKTACFDTGNDPAAVQAAVMAAGGKPSGATGSWQVTVSGHAVTVSLWDSSPFLPDNPGMHPHICEVQADFLDWPAIDAAVVLVGGMPHKAPASGADNPGLQVIVRKRDGAQWLPAPQTAMASDKSGTIWALVASGTGASTDLQFVHVVPDAVP
jgi:hypothetical protein